MRWFVAAAARFAILAVASSFAPAGPAERELVNSEIARGVVADATAEVEQLRGLSFKDPVPVHVVDDAHLREYVLERMRKFDRQAHYDASQTVYELLGLVPEGMDILGSLLDAMEEQAGGYYDPDSGAYFLLDDAPAGAAALYTVHELTHAVEDQHFDLDRQLREVIDDDDRVLAISAVHEGSAMLVMGAYMEDALARGDLDHEVLEQLMQTEAGREEKLGALPSVLRRQLLAPYLLGPVFLARGNKNVGALESFPFDDADRAMRDGPTSTEQILHPKKYWKRRHRDDPRTLAPLNVDGLLGGEWTRAGSGVLGELTLAALVEAPGTASKAMADIPWTNQAAAGWGGDRWELWTGGDEAVVLLLTAWDSGRDAREFQAALAGDDSLHARRYGRHVAVVAGDAAGDAPNRLLDRMLDAGR